MRDDGELLGDVGNVFDRHVPEEFQGDVKGVGFQPPDSGQLLALLERGLDVRRLTADGLRGRYGDEAALRHDLPFGIFNHHMFRRHPVFRLSGHSESGGVIAKFSRRLGVHDTTINKIVNRTES